MSQHLKSRKNSFVQKDTLHHHGNVSLPHASHEDQQNRVLSTSKPLATSNSNNKIRLGDWVCLLCNNLNYSFRLNCNRCKNLTREQNMKLNHVASQPSFETRQGLKEILVNVTQEEPLPRKTVVIEEKQVKSETKPKPTGKRLLGLGEGFESLVFLTPTRYIKQNQEDPEQENQGKQKGYTSPKFLPSVSPLLRSLKSSLL